MGPSDPIGIIAGGGSLPGEIARSIVSRGSGVHVIWVEGSAEEELKAFPHTVVNWANLGRAVAALRKANVKRVVFVGKTARPVWRTAKPDMTFLRALPAVIKLLKAGGDDAVLRGLLAIFESKGFEIAGAGDVAPELLVGLGPFGAIKPAANDWADIAKGFALVSALGRHDIGQGAIVSGGVIEAIEGAEGTDRMIARVGENRMSAGANGSGAGAGVLVKRPKPGQDLRVDLPAIGPDTVIAAVGAGLAGIAVMAGHVLAASRAELVRRADQNRIFVTGAEAVAPVSAEPVRATSANGLSILGKRRPAAAIMADALGGLRIMRDLAAFETGSALLMARGRVLAIGAGERPEDVILRWAQFLRAKSRAGVVVLGDREPLTGALVEIAAGANIAGFVVLCAPGDDRTVSQLAVANADKLGLFVACGDAAARGTPR